MVSVVYLGRLKVFRRLFAGLGAAAILLLTAAPAFAHDCFNPNKPEGAGVNYTSRPLPLPARCSNSPAPASESPASRRSHLAFSVLIPLRLDPPRFGGRPVRALGRPL